MAMNLEYFYATEQWDDVIADKVKKLYATVLEVDIDSFFDPECTICTMWNRLIKTLYGEDLYLINTIDDIKSIIKDKKYELIENAMNEYALIEPDVWIMASLSIAYIEGHPIGKNGHADDISDYVPENVPWEPYASEFKKYLKNTILYQKSYPSKTLPEDILFWRDNRIQNERTDISALSWDRVWCRDRKCVSYALKYNRHEFTDFMEQNEKLKIAEILSKEGYTKSYFEADSKIQDYQNKKTKKSQVDENYLRRKQFKTEDCLLYAKYVNPELVRKCISLIFSDELNIDIYKKSNKEIVDRCDHNIKEYMKLLDYNSLTWQQMLAEMLVYTNKYSCEHRHEKKSGITMYDKMFIEVKTEEQKFYDYVLEKKTEYLSDESIKDMNRLLYVLTMGVLYLYFKSKHRDVEKFIINEKAIKSYLRLHDVRFMEKTPNDLKEGIILKRQNMNYEIQLDGVINKLMSDYCKRCVSSDDSLELNKTHYDLTEAYVYLQETTIKSIQHRFMEKNK